MQLNNNLLSRNELRLYMKKLIDNITNNEQNQKIKELGIFTNAIERNNKLKILLKNFYENMEKTGFKFNCNHNLDNRNYRVYNPLKMGSIIKNTANTWNSSHSIYKYKNSSSIGGAKDFGITSSLRRGFDSGKSIASGLGMGVASGVYRTIGKAATPIIRHAPIMSKENKNYFTENNKKEKKNFKLPAMCDKILFALSEKKNNQGIPYTPLQYNNDFTVFENLKKSRNKPIYVTFTY